MPVSVIARLAATVLVGLSAGCGTGAASDNPGGDVVTCCTPGEGGASGPGVCAHDWCWEARLPQGNTLHAVWGASENDVWMGGDKGTLLHWNGASFAAFSSGDDTPITAIQGKGAGDIWAVAGRRLLHWNGVAWTSIPMPVDYATDVWSAGPNDTWVTGNSQGIWHWNGSAWRNEPEGAFLSSLFGTSGNDVWFVGEAGAIRHWDGAMLSIVPSGTTNGLTAIRGRRADDI